MAADPNTPVEKLREIVKGDNELALIALAKNPKAPPDVLEKLFERILVTEVLLEEDTELIKKYLAMNQNTPVEILEKLAGDKKSELERL
ncbi:MAG: hypothetical protein QXR62_03515 [Candidatus Bathyarchaeia archaeon]